MGCFVLVCSFVFVLFLIRIGRIKQLHFELFAFGYVHENVRSNQFALTNLHLSVSFFWVFIEFKNTEEASNTTGERTFSCLIEGRFCFGRISRDVYPMFGQVVSINCTVPSKQAECNNISKKLLNVMWGDPGWPWKSTESVCAL